MTEVVAEKQGAPAYRLSFPHAMRSEWIKLITVRSTWWSVAITAVLSLVPSLLIALSIDRAAAALGGVGGVQIVFGSLGLVMLFAGIFGAITATGEYSSGLIRSTLTADPIRGRVLAAKVVVVAAFLFVVALVILTVSGVVVGAILAGKGSSIDWSDFDTTIRPILLASVSVAAIAVIGLALGFMFRAGAAAIAGIVGLLFVLPIILSLFSLAGRGWMWVQDALSYLPMSAAQGLVFASAPGGGGIPIWGAALALGAWTAAALLGAWVVLRTRSA
jgi:ABC-2 type transport system permease protein